MFLYRKNKQYMIFASDIISVYRVTHLIIYTLYNKHEIRFKMIFFKIILTHCNLFLLDL